MSRGLATRRNVGRESPVCLNAHASLGLGRRRTHTHRSRPLDGSTLASRRCESKLPVHSGRCRRTRRGVGLPRWMARAGPYRGSAVLPEMFAGETSTVSKNYAATRSSRGVTPNRQWRRVDCAANTRVRSAGCDQANPSGGEPVKQRTISGKQMKAMAGRCGRQASRAGRI